MVQAKDLKKGNKIVMDGMNFTIINIDVSKIAKHGKSKCRIEAVDNRKQKKVFIVLSDQEIQLE